MGISLLLLLKFVYDIVKRLIDDAYFRSLGILVVIMAGVGTLFFWLVEGRSFLQALAYAVSTLCGSSGLPPRHSPQPKWYGTYIVARQRGRTPEEAVTDATLHVEGAVVRA